MARNGQRSTLSPEAESPIQLERGLYVNGCGRDAAVEGCAVCSCGALRRIECNDPCAGGCGSTGEAVSRCAGVYDPFDRGDEWEGIHLDGSGWKSDVARQHPVAGTGVGGGSAGGAG